MATAPTSSPSAPPAPTTATARCTSTRTLRRRFEAHRRAAPARRARGAADSRGLGREPRTIRRSEACREWCVTARLANYPLSPVCEGGAPARDAPWRTAERRILAGSVASPGLSAARRSPSLSPPLPMSPSLSLSPSPSLSLSLSLSRPARDGTAGWPTHRPSRRRRPPRNPPSSDRPGSPSRAPPRGRPARRRAPRTTRSTRRLSSRSRASPGKGCARRSLPAGSGRPTA